MDEKIRTTVDDEETPDGTPSGGPLSRLVEKELTGSPDPIEEKVPKPEESAIKKSVEYAEGTTEHHDDREG